MVGSLIVVSGPSGSGKTSVSREVCRRLGEKAYFSISTTTRPRREGEKDGVDYFFISKEEFEKGIERGEFIEWAEVHGNYYGTGKSQIEKGLKEGKIIFLDIDVQGHRNLKKLFPRWLTSVFITTPNRQILIERLRLRGEKEEIIARRVENAREEMEAIKEYEFLIINDTFEESVDKLLKIVEISQLKVSRIDLPQFITQWWEGKGEEG
jgi:guanylate kinase